MVKPVLPRNIAEQLIYTLIFSHLDYFNSLSPVGTKQQLFVYSKNKIQQPSSSLTLTPVLAEFHWLLIHYRIQFNILQIAIKALNGFEQLYISELLIPYSALTPQISKPNPVHTTMIEHLWFLLQHCGTNSKYQSSVVRAIISKAFKKHTCTDEDLHNVFSKS